MPNDTENAMDIETLNAVLPPINILLAQEHVKHPTRSQFGVYQDIYSFFNATLFNGELPNVVLNFSRKGKRTLGFFAPERWGSSDLENNKDAIHELSLNPDTLRERSREDVLSTIVHEMCHIWRHHQPGKTPKRGYHDKIWGKKMEEVGLMPSNTGAEGGKKTGVQMTHYIIKGGAFEHAAKDVAQYLPLIALPPDAAKKRNLDKVKYTCECGHKVWGKQGLTISCGDCDGGYVQAEV